MSRKIVLATIVLPAIFLFLLALVNTHQVVGKVTATKWQRFTFVEEKRYLDAEGDVLPNNASPVPGIDVTAWVKVSRLMSSGNDNSPVWPTREVEKSQRIVTDTEKYFVTITYLNGHVQYLESSNPAYNNYLIGMPIDGIFNGLGFLVDYSPRP